VYKALLQPIEEIFKNKHLLIAPTGALTQLSFQVPVTEKPDTAAGQSRRGSSMTRAFPSKGHIRSAWRTSIAAKDNCQVAVTLSLANHHASLPVAYRLYLPKVWVEDEERRRKARYVRRHYRQDEAGNSSRTIALGM
jgi:hypothetical protein